MYKIPGFYETIIGQFTDVIEEYKFELRRGLNETRDELQLVNDKCIVRFLADAGLVLCDFTNPVEKAQRESMPRKGVGPVGFPTYPAFSVWKFLYPNDKVNYSYDGRDLDGQVQAKKRLLLERLTNVLGGDFSWAEDFKVNNARLSRKVEYMMTHWAMDNPVRERFRKGNPEWEKDFDEYKAYLDSLGRPPKS